MIGLSERRCRPCTGATVGLTLEQLTKSLAELPGWNKVAGGTAMERRFEFRDFHQTMAFVNAVAWIAHREDHHPELVVGYRTCVVRFSTHAIGTVSDNDLICASKVNDLISDLGAR